MTVSYEMIKVLERNLEQDITLFNYDKVVKKTVSEFKGVISSFSPELKEEYLSILNNLLYDKLFDIFPECLRDKFNWDRYFRDICKEVPIVSIDVYQDEFEIPEWVMEDD